MNLCFKFEISFQSVGNNTNSCEIWGESSKEKSYSWISIEKSIQLFYMYIFIYFLRFWNRHFKNTIEIEGKSEHFFKTLNALGLNSNKCKYDILLKNIFYIKVRIADIIKLYISKKIT